MVVLPRTLLEFERDRQLDHMDFAKALVCAFAELSSTEVWNRHLNGLVEVVATIEQEVTDSGGCVIPQGRSDDLREAMACGSDDLGNSIKFLCLIAHRRFVPLAVADILAPDLFLKKLRQILAGEGTSRVDLALRAGLARFHLESENMVLSDAVNAMVSLLDSARRYYEDYSSWWLVNVSTSSKALDFPAGLLTRTDLDGHFDDSLLPGHEVELRDGLVSVRDLARLIPLSFDGFVQLDLCHSIVVAERLKRLRPRAHFIASTRRVHPVRALARFITLFRVLHRQPCPILHALDVIRAC